jgi:hypothetical protein
MADELMSPPQSRHSDPVAGPGQQRQDDVAGLDHWRPAHVVVESAAMPADGIFTAESGATSYAIHVRLRRGLQWVICKRYSELRSLHDRLKAVGAPVKHLHFPSKHFTRNLKASALEQRRRELEGYLSAVLEETHPFIRVELVNFLGVHENVETQVRARRATAIGLVRPDPESDTTASSEAMESSVEEPAKRRSVSDSGQYPPQASPDTLTTDSSSGRPSDRSESPGSSTESAMPSQIDECIEMCLRMDELLAMSEDVVERLLRARNRLAETDLAAAAPRDVQSRYESMARRFHAFLDQHADRSTIERLVSARTLVGVLMQMNRELDALHSDLGLEASTWASSWDQMVSDVEVMLLNTWTANGGRLQTELPDAEAQHDALLLLTNERRRADLQRSSSSRQLLEAAVETVARMSDATIEAVPDRFVAEHEVQRDSEPFSSGSSGTVYRGVYMGAKVVIKYVNVHSAADLGGFLQEGKIWHMARHPNIVTYYGACHLSRPCFFVSEEAVNGSAVEFIAKSKTQGRPRVWRTMLGAAVGLRFLHENHIVHGDLKGNNIVVDASGVAKLTDLGMSFLTGSSSPSRTGAFRWTAPECLVRNAPPSFQSDRFSLGMCIIEAATGSVPWGTRVADAVVVDKLAHGEFLTRPAQLDDAQWSLVTSLCAFEPRQRCSLSDAIGQLEGFAVAAGEADIL